MRTQLLSYSLMLLNLIVLWTLFGKIKLLLVPASCQGIAMHMYDEHKLYFIFMKQMKRPDARESFLKGHCSP